jgi:hypothetical protein
VSARTLDGVFESLERLADSSPEAQIDVECAVRALSGAGSDVMAAGCGGAACYCLLPQPADLTLKHGSPAG